MNLNHLKSLGLVGFFYVTALPVRDLKYDGKPEEINLRRLNVSHNFILEHELFGRMFYKWVTS